MGLTFGYLICYNTYEGEAVLDGYRIGWLVGILEGEGCFYKRPGGPSGDLQIGLQMTDKDVVDKVAEVWSKSPRSLRQSKRPNRKFVYTIRLYGRRAAKLMQSIRSLMGERRQGQIDKALAAYHPQHRTDCNVKGCTRKHYAKGLCNVHYQRQRDAR